jgi:hypothetical protein
MHPRPKIKKIMGAVPPDWSKVFCQDEKPFVCVNVYCIGLRFLTTLEYFVRTKKNVC